jgi:hypothetical protein
MSKNIDATPFSPHTPHFRPTTPIFAPLSDIGDNAAGAVVFFGDLGREF